MWRCIHCVLVVRRDPGFGTSGGIDIELENIDRICKDPFRFLSLLYEARNDIQ